MLLLEQYWAVFALGFTLTSFVKLNQCSATVSVNIVTFGTTSLNTTISLALIAPAMDSAMIDLQTLYSTKFNFTHIYLYLPRTVPFTEISGYSDDILADWFYNNRSASNVTAFILPGGTEDANINRLTAGWNSLLITCASAILPSTYVLGEKLHSQSWISTTHFSLPIVSQLYINIFRYFKWRSLYIVVDQTSPFIYKTTAAALSQMLIKIGGFQQTLLTISVDDEDSLDIFQSLSEFKNISRILVFLGSSSNLRKFLLMARSKNMTNGEYVYLALQPFAHKSFGKFTWQCNDADDKVARSSFKSVILLSPGPSEVGLGPRMSQLVDLWKNESYNKYGYKYLNDEALVPHVTSAYKTFMIFGQVLNESLVNENGDIGDGRALAQRMTNRRFITDETVVRIDETGQRRATWIASIFNETLGKFEVFLFQDKETGTIQQTKEIDWFGGPTLPPNQPLCGYQNNDEKCQQRTPYISLFVGTTISLILMILAALSAFFLIRNRCTRKVEETSWLLDRNCLRLKNPFFVDGISSQGYRASYREMDVWITHCQLRTNYDTPKNSYTSASNSKINSNLLVNHYDEILRTTHIIRLIQQISQPNINRFIGLLIPDSGEPQVGLVSAFAERGSLHDLFDTSFRLNWDIKSSLMVDFLNGMVWIHASLFKFHGALGGSTCLVDRHLGLKISKLGFRQIFERLHKKSCVGCTTKMSTNYKAPELLRDGCLPNRTTDSYAAGVILFEIAAGSKRQTEDYGVVGLSTENLQLMDNEIVPEGVMDITYSCLSPVPNERPTMHMILNDLMVMSQPFSGRTYGTLAEKIVYRLEKYALTLEKEVAERTVFLLDERSRCDQILNHLLPHFVVAQLRSGLPVRPEVFDNVTILFSEFDGFVKMASFCTAYQVMTLLEEIYLAVENVLSEFDVYNVETIVECYVIASGIPVRNGDNHVNEICSVALEMQNVVAVFSKWEINLKIGIHSGSCAAGIVGIQKPKYCLFGDTINMASRMANYGCSNRIQISLSTALLLKRLSLQFILIERGEIEVKGKGQIKTFWIISSF